MVKCWYGGGLVWWRGWYGEVLVWWRVGMVEGLVWWRGWYGGGLVWWRGKGWYGGGVRVGMVEDGSGGMVGAVLSVVTVATHNHTPNCTTSS